MGLSQYPPSVSCHRHLESFFDNANYTKPAHACFSTAQFHHFIIFDSKLSRPYFLSQNITKNVFFTLAVSSHLHFNCGLFLNRTQAKLISRWKKKQKHHFLSGRCWSCGPKNSLLKLVRSKQTNKSKKTRHKVFKNCCALLRVAECRIDGHELMYLVVAVCKLSQTEHEQIIVFPPSWG